MTGKITWYTTGLSIPDSEIVYACKIPCECVTSVVSAVCLLLSATPGEGKQGKTALKN